MHTNNSNKVLSSKKKFNIFFPKATFSVILVSQRLVLVLDNFEFTQDVH